MDQIKILRGLRRGKGASAGKCEVPTLGDDRGPHVGAQTVKLTTEEAQELARELTSVATALHAKIWAKGKAKAQ